MGIVEFLAARIQEDVEVSRTRHGERSLDELIDESRWQVVEWAYTWLGRDCAPWNETALRILAAPYADHPDFDEAWRL